MNNDLEKSIRSEKVSTEKLYSYSRLLREGVDAVELFEV